MAGNIGKPVPASWMPVASPALQKQAAVLDKGVKDTVTKYYPTPGTGGQEGVTRTFEVSRPPTTQEALATGAFAQKGTRSSGRTGPKGGRSKKVKRSRKQKRTTRKQRR